MNLVLNTYGSSLCKENNSFVIIHKDGRQLIASDHIKTITISKGASITSDAALMAIENGIEVLFVDHAGMPIGRLWSVKYGSISTIRRNQLDFSLSENAIEWIKKVIIQKIDNQVALLYSLMPENYINKTNVDASINRINVYSKKIAKLNGSSIVDIAPSLRGWEGAASKIYFETLAFFLPTEYKFIIRSQHPALDIFNCLLNYGYGMLYGKIEGALIKAGIDPYVGVFHRDDYNRPVLVFDIIEIFRVWIDYIVFNLCMQNAINEDCYCKKADGSYWLEALGRRILIQSVNDYFAEVINMNGIDRSRTTHIELYAQNLAQMFLKNT
ncbi:MAG TPA: CRISPR-associated endonuclease Cas1 [Bacteroidales bacterium]|nr:CRISPR-associated endonuclease Cas1 [Bacteroidales bacterium]